MASERFRLISVVHVLLLDRNRVLLLRRYNTGYQDGNYDVIAGHLDGDEPVTSAAAREALEEAGIRIQPTVLRVVHVMHLHEDDREGVHFFLTASIWEGEPRNMEPDKCDELAWYQIDALPQNLVPHVKAAIEFVQQGTNFSEVGWGTT